MDAAIPAGFCPKCFYPMNPGVCPECGLPVPPDRLRRRRRGTFWRENRGAILAVFVSAVLFILGYLACVSVDLVSLAPTGALIWLDGGRPGRISAELERRFLSGSLTAEHRDEFIEQSLSHQLEIRTPYPAGYEIGMLLSIRPGPAVLAGATGCFLESYELSLDGRTVETSTDVRGADWRRGSELNWRLSIPAESAGEHLVTLRGRAYLSPRFAAASSAKAALHSWDFSVEAPLSIEDRPIEQFLASIDDADVRAQVDRGLRMRRALPGQRDDGSERASNLFIRLSRLPAPIAGELWARPSGEGRYEKIGDCCMTFPAWYYLREETARKLPQADRIDVRILPSAAVALRRLPPKMRTYFGGVLERRGIELNDEK